MKAYDVVIIGGGPAGFAAAAAQYWQVSRSKCAGTWQRCDHNQGRGLTNEMINATLKDDADLYMCNGTGDLQNACKKVSI